MGGGVTNDPQVIDKDEELAALRTEVSRLAGISEAYASAQQRVERAEEMAQWAERNEARANEEAMEARAMCNEVRMRVHAQECVADYRRRAQTAERKLSRVKAQLNVTDMAGVIQLLDNWDEI